MANKDDYAKAAEAVKGGYATQTQKDLNNKMANNPRFGSTAVQSAQDSRK